MPQNVYELLLLYHNQIFFKQSSLNSPHKGPVTRKNVPFDDTIMIILTKDGLVYRCLFASLSLNELMPVLTSTD